MQRDKRSLGQLACGELVDMETCSVKFDFVNMMLFPGRPTSGSLSSSLDAALLEEQQEEDGTVKECLRSDICLAKTLTFVPRLLDALDQIWVLKTIVETPARGQYPKFAECLCVVF